MSQDIQFRSLNTPEEFKQLMVFETDVWPGADPVPDHLLITATQNGGITIGAFLGDRMIGFVFGFVGLYEDGVKHCSHMLGVHPDHRDRGLGYSLKRAQWQMVRKQGIDLITWTYDPLESRNANLNIAKLGAVCNTYKLNIYGDMSDELNIGIPSDRFQVDWWVNSARVEKRLSKSSRGRLGLEQYTSADALVLNSTELNDANLPIPHKDEMPVLQDPAQRPPVVLFEFPSDYQGIKAADIELAQEWRMYSRMIFDLLFHHGYLVTDFVFQGGEHPRSYYVLSQGDTTLGV